MIVEWPLAWALTLFLLAIDLVWALQIGMTFGGAGLQICWVGLLLVLCIAYRRRNRRIANMAEAWALWFAFTPVLAALSYLAATCNFPLQDELFEHLDRMIGFDWIVWSKLITGRPTVRWALLLAYVSLLPLTMFAMIYFPAAGKSERVGELYLLSGTAGAVTIFISAIMPALGPFAEHVGTDVAHLPDLLQLRSGGPWLFKFSAMEGVVSMPSYHTVIAVLLAYAFRHTGLLGYGIATLNIMMLASIPTMGGHYLVDVIAGGALAISLIAVQRQLKKRHQSSTAAEKRNAARQHAAVSL